jgi:hypothetical protein
MKIWRRKKAKAAPAATATPTPAPARQPPAEDLGEEVAPGTYVRDTCMGRVTTIVPGRARALPDEERLWRPWRPWSILGRRN